MRALEQPKGHISDPYSLQSTELPFLLRFAQRRSVADPSPIGGFGETQSDGATTSNDGSEAFDWLNDD
ncbi:MAG: hypothetical protein J2P37_30295 [Ktedonobacteraceae bacterium]|nr:hypothetical protein [Ktedonobacteraceae bacterium]